MEAADETVDLQRVVYCTDSFESALQVIRDYEIETTSKFSISGQRKKDFGHAGFSPSEAHFILWEQKGNKGLPFVGVPFIVLNHMYMDCANGPERHQRYKEAFARLAAQKLDHVHRRKKVTKKINCPARITLRELVCFPEYGIPQDSKGQRAKISKVLRQDLKNGKEVILERKIIVCVPDVSEHNHVIGAVAGPQQPIDHHLKKKITDLVRHRITDTTEIRKHLAEYVRTVLFRDSTPPPPTNRRFFPTKIDIQNHVMLSLKKVKAENEENGEIYDVVPSEPINPDNFVVYCPNANNTLRDINDEEDHEAIVLVCGEEVEVASNELAQNDKLNCLPESNINGDLQPAEEIHDENLATLCREQLTKLKNQTYDVNNRLLGELSAKLTDIIDWLSQSATKEQNGSGETPSVTRKRTKSISISETDTRPKDTLKSSSLTPIKKKKSRKFENEAEKAVMGVEHSYFSCRDVIFDGLYTCTQEEVINDVIEIVYE